MPSSKTPNPPSDACSIRSRPWLLPTIPAALFLLSACGVADRVVIQPVSLPPVDSRLTAPLQPPACELRDAEAYPPEQLEAARACEAAGGRMARQRHAALASAVRVREKAAAEAVKSTR